MKILKKSDKKTSISIILCDWGCRESYHIFHYLKRQEFKDFEIIWIEYYDKVASIYEYVDTFIVLNIDKNFFYHKHLLYNVGIFFSNGEIIVIMDSDVMLRPTFTKSIYNEFYCNENIVLHLDEFRNINPSYYPFNYPSFEEFFETGCKNYGKNGITTGLEKRYDPIHNLNFGACMCAKKEDLITIQGADESIEYLGYICGPYEMTFRLMNLGKKLRWCLNEFLYHTWHPGSDGDALFKEKHDGMFFSLKALELLDNNKIYPDIQNKGILFNDEKKLLENINESWKKR